MHRWSNRYFALCGSTLVYKLKKDSTSVRRTYDLMAGCILTEVEDDSAAKKGKHLYSFWIVWPQIEDDKKQAMDVKDEPLSDDDEERDHPRDHSNKPKDLKEVLRRHYSKIFACIISYHIILWHTISSHHIILWHIIS
jgi:hypothetical protein